MITSSVPAAAAVDPQERRGARLALLIVVLVVAGVHAVLVGFDRPINWDEAVYVSQVNPSVPAVFMEPHRTRGVPLLVAPVAVFDPSMVVLRAYLLALGSIATYAAFALWIPTIGFGAPVAAGLYSSFWVTAFYTVEALPNHPSALVAVALAGITARIVTGAPKPRDPLIVGALMALFASLRPPDAVLVGLGLVFVLLLTRQREVLRASIAAAIGGAVAVAVWLLEGWTRFGFGPFDTIGSGSEYAVAVGRVNLLPLYLRSLETRLRCAGSCVDDFAASGAAWTLPPARTTLFLAAVVAVSLAGVVIERRRYLTYSVPIIFAVPLVLFYGFAGGAMNQRYLLPAYALLLIPPAAGLRAIARVVGGRSKVLGASVWVVALSLLIVAAAWSLSKAVDRLEAPATRDRAAAIGEVLQQETGRQDADCALVARVNYPQLQYWSGCRTSIAGDGNAGQIQPPLGELGSYVDVASLHAGGATVYAVDRVDLPEASPLRSWEVLDPDAEPISGYVIYRYVDGADLPPPPCPPAGEGPTRRLAEVLGAGC